MRDHFNSASLDQAAVVRGFAGSADRLSAGTSSLGQAAYATQVKHLSSESGVVQPSCLEIIRRSHQGQGFSEEASRRIAKARKDSTLAVYQGK